MTELRTNIKNLPEGEYVTGHSYSDSNVFRVVKRTPKTMTVVPVEVEIDPDFKPEFHVGGFAAHCSNQDGQSWVYKGTMDYEIVIRLNKKGWQDKGGKRYTENKAWKFYDYNF